MNGTPSHTLSSLVTLTGTPPFSTITLQGMMIGLTLSLTFLMTHSTPSLILKEITMVDRLYTRLISPTLHWTKGLYLRLRYSTLTMSMISLIPLKSTTSSSLTRFKLSQHNLPIPQQVARHLHILLMSLNTSLTLPGNHLKNQTHFCCHNPICTHAYEYTPH